MHGSCSEGTSLEVGASQLEGPGEQKWRNGVRGHAYFDEYGTKLHGGPENSRSYTRSRLAMDGWGAIEAEGAAGVGAAADYGLAP